MKSLQLKKPTTTKLNLRDKEQSALLGNDRVVTWVCKLYFYELYLQRACLKRWVSCGML